MSVLLLLISALVLIYLGIGGITVVIVFVIVMVVGLFQDGWHIFSILFGGGLFAFSLVLVLPGDLWCEKFSVLLLNWVRGWLLKFLDIEVEVLCLGIVDWDGELFFGQFKWLKLLDVKLVYFFSEE